MTSTIIRPTTPPTVEIKKPVKPPLVALWVKDQEGRLVCQWVRD